MSDTRVSDLTVAEFKALVREVVEETLADLLADPDEGPELAEDFKSELRSSLKSIKDGDAVFETEDTAWRLGLEE